MAAGSATEQRAQAVSALDVVRYVTDNLILDEEGVWWAVYRLNGVTYDLLSYTGKFEVFAAMESGLSALSTRVKILSVVRNFRQEDYIERLKERNRRNMDYQGWCELVSDRLGSRSPFYREFYLCIRLRGSAATPTQAAQLAARKIENWARAVLNLPTTFRAHEIEEAKDYARQMGGAFASLIQQPASPEDIMWLVRRGPYRAIGEPPIVDGWRPKAYLYETGDGINYYEPSGSDTRKLVGDVPMRQRLRQLEFFHGDGQVSYQRVLAISSMPFRQLQFPGSEWAYNDRDIDMVMDFDVIPSGQSERQRKAKSRQAKQQKVHVDESEGDINVQLAQAHAADKDLEFLNSQGKPRLDCYVTMILAASSEERLDSLTQDVKQDFDQLRMGVSLARGSQVQGFADCLPCGKRKLTDYHQPISSTNLSGGMPIGDSALGDGQGFYIGYPKVSNGVVAYDPALPMKSNMNGSCALIGDLGSGKTLTYLTLMSYFALSGHQCLLIDPKGDSRSLRNVPEVEELMREVEVAPGSPTRLPILSIYPEGMERRTQDLLRNFLLNILETQEDPLYSQVVRTAVRDFMNRPERHRRRVSQLLDVMARSAHDAENSQDLQDSFTRASKALEYYMEDSLAELVLADDAEEGEVLGRGMDSPITVIQTWGLALPDREKVQEGGLSDDERISQAVLSVVAATAFQMASKDRMKDHKPFKALGFDEAWRFLSNSEGRRLLEYLIREGRSQNVAAYVMTQRWADIVKGEMASLLNIRFMGRQQRDEEDIALGLTTLGIDPTDEYIQMVKGFSPGDFIHQDMYDKRGAMHFDPVPPEWIDLLGSTPDEESEDESLTADATRESG